MAETWPEDRRDAKYWQQPDRSECNTVQTICDTLKDSIFTEECSVKIELYPRQSSHKVGEQCPNKGQQKIEGLT